MLYENPATRERAVKLCDDFVTKSGGDPEPEVHWQSFAELGSSGTADPAAEAAAVAEIIIFAISAQGDLPAHVKSWTEKWLGKRGEREGVLIGLLLDGRNNPCEIACLKEVYLRHLAHRAGMDYLTHLPALTRAVIPDSLDAFNERAGQTSSLLDDILHQPFVPPSLPI